MKAYLVFGYENAVILHIYPRMHPIKDAGVHQFLVFDAVVNILHEVKVMLKLSIDSRNPCSIVEDRVELLYIVVLRAL